SLQLQRLPRRARKIPRTRRSQRQRPADRTIMRREAIGRGAMRADRSLVRRARILIAPVDAQIRRAGIGFHRDAGGFVAEAGDLESALKVVTFGGLAAIDEMR